ncbi:MAG: sigma-70 family RNA polymerase sigma factor [Alloprevotella sp.]|nr:sigma-70 family RNA polymerase sigma factor [Alloprevotella sp.]
MPNIDFRSDLLPLKNKLFRLALRITMDAVEAEDVTEDTLIRVWEKRSELENIRSLEAYCLTVCRNLALDRHNLRANQNDSLDDTDHEAIDVAPSPLDQLVNSDNLARVREIFARLPERQRTMLQLRDIEGLRHSQIAEIMQTSEETVKVTICRARQRMRKDFETIENYGL